MLHITLPLALLFSSSFLFVALFFFLSFLLFSQSVPALFPLLSLSFFTRIDVIRSASGAAAFTFSLHGFLSNLFHLSCLIPIRRMQKRINNPSSEQQNNQKREGTKHGTKISENMVDQRKAEDERKFTKKTDESCSGDELQRGNCSDGKKGFGTKIANVNMQKRDKKEMSNDITMTNSAAKKGK